MAIDSYDTPTRKARGKVVRAYSIDQNGDVKEDTASIDLKEGVEFNHYFFYDTCLVKVGANNEIELENLDAK